MSETLDLAFDFAVEGPVEPFTIDRAFDFAVEGVNAPFTLDLAFDFEITPLESDCFIVWAGERVPARMRITTADGRFP